MSKETRGSFLPPYYRDGHYISKIYFVQDVVLHLFLLE